MAEFAAHAGLTLKVARRHLDVATHSLFNRHVHLVYGDGMESQFVWASSRTLNEDYYDLQFSGTFIRYMLTAFGRDDTVATRGVLAFADAVEAPAILRRGDKAPYGLSVVIISRLKARRKRPKGMSMCRLLERVAKRLKPTVHKDRIEDIFDVVRRTMRWGGKDDPTYYKFTHKDLDELYTWVIANMDNPDFYDE